MHCQQRGPRRAAEIVDVRVRCNEVSGQLGDHPLLLCIERHGAADHVVEDSDHFLAEAEIRNGCVGVVEDLITPREQFFGRDMGLS